MSPELPKQEIIKIVTPDYSPTTLQNYSPEYDFLTRLARVDGFNHIGEDTVKNLIENGDSHAVIEISETNISYGIVIDGFDEDKSKCTGNFGRGALSLNVLNLLRNAIIGNPNAYLPGLLNVINKNLIGAKHKLNSLKISGESDLLNRTLGSLEQTDPITQQVYETIENSDLFNNWRNDPNSTLMWSETNASAAIYKIFTDSQTGKRKVAFTKAGHARVYAIGEKDGKIFTKEITSSQDFKPLGLSQKTRYTEGEIDIDDIFDKNNPDEKGIKLKYITASTITLPDTLEPPTTNKLIKPGTYKPDPIITRIGKSLKKINSEHTLIGHREGSRTINDIIGDWLEKPLSRRNALKWGGAGVTLVASALLSSRLSNIFRSIGNFFRRSELSIISKPEITKLFEDIPNKELIIEISEDFFTKAPGDFSLPLEFRVREDDPEARVADLVALEEAANAAHVLNKSGKDRRSIHEMALMAALESSYNPQLRSTLLTNDETKDLVRQIDMLLTTENWKSRSKDKVTVGDMMLALQSCGSIKAREWGLSILNNLQNEGKLDTIGFEKLSEEEQIWCNKFGVSETSLIWAKLTREHIIEVLTEGTDLFFDNLSKKEREIRVKNLKNTVCNPGIIAMLNLEETRNMTNVGDVPAEPQLNTSEGWYPTGPKDLEIIGEMLEKSTGLHYTKEFKNGDGKLRTRYRYLHSSGRFGHGSGGALFGQFMPINLVYFMERVSTVYDRLKLKGKEYPALLPGSTFGMCVLQYLYLNGQWNQIQGNIDGTKTIDKVNYKGGYIAGDMTCIEKAISSWNPFPEEVERIKDAGIAYSNIQSKAKAKSQKNK